MSTRGSHLCSFGSQSRCAEVRLSSGLSVATRCLTEVLQTWECGCRSQRALLDTRRRCGYETWHGDRLAVFRVRGLQWGCGRETQTAACRSEWGTFGLVGKPFSPSLPIIWGGEGGNSGAAEKRRRGRTREGFPSAMEPHIAGNVSRASDTQGSPRGTGLVTAGIAPQLFRPH